jgi:hypothetical protein
MTVVPSYPDLPMEDVYPRVPKTGIPAVHINDTGKGRVVYFPWDIDRTFWEVLAKDHLLLLRNAVTWVTNEEPVVAVDGLGVLDVTVWEQADSVTVHLVNLTNPMMMKGPIREIYPVGPLTVRVRLPWRPRSVRQLVAGGTIARDGGAVRVPRVELHEVLAFER